MSISRRELLAMMAVAWVDGRALSAASESHAAVVNMVTEWSFESRKTYRDPFNEVELDVDFIGPDGATFRVPAFWAGELTRRVRFAPPVPGPYRYQTRCSDNWNTELHGVEDGYKSCLRLLDLPERPTAILCSNSALLLGLVRALGERGVRCPEEMSLIGFDHPIWTENSTPPLTTLQAAGKLWFFVF